MGVSFLTALIIQSRGKDVKCLAGGPSKDKRKYAGWISLYRDGEYDHDLLSTEDIYNSKKEAVNAMKKIVSEIRSMDLTPPVVGPSND